MCIAKPMVNCFASAELGLCSLVQVTTNRWLPNDPMALGATKPPFPGAAP